jgi:hypothetical protein
MVNYIAFWNFDVGDGDNRKGGLSYEELRETR